MTNNALSHPIEPLYFGSLPEVAETRGGAKFYPRSDTWEIREATRKLNADFAFIPITDNFKTAFKCALLWHAENLSLSFLKNSFFLSKDFFEYKFSINGELVFEITSVDILNYKAAIGKEKEWYIGMLSGFLRRWSAFGYAGIAESAVTLLNQLTLQGNQKGKAVATRDPIRGPFTNTELEALQFELNAAYGRKDVSLGEFVLCWLFMTLGMRPTQYALLKVCDVYRFVDNNGLYSYVIRMPRAKNGESNPRAEFKERILIPEVGRLVGQYVSEIRLAFIDKLPNLDDAPLFPAASKGNAPKGYEFHQTAQQLSYGLVKTLKRLYVVSERTGDLIHITAKRFRYTVGTRAAEEGHGELVIAEILDHADTQNVGVYVSSTPEIIERIDKAVALQLAPLAQAFAGKIIKGPSEASRADDPTSTIRAPSITNSFEGMSSCGKHGFCGFLKPIACYTCNSFEPWLDGPHEVVLDFLLAERKRLMKSTDPKIASVNDRTIWAVAQVVLDCREVRAQVAGAE